jgi:hypothetical protein
MYDIQYLCTHCQHTYTDNYVKDYENDEIHKWLEAQKLVDKLKGNK